MSKNGDSRQSPNFLLGLALVVIVVIASFTFLASHNRAETQFSETSPQGVIQLYLKAVYLQDSNKAHNYFSSSNICTADDLDRAGFPLSSSVKLIDSEISGNSAIVRIEVEMGSDGVFESGFRERHSYRLTKFNDQWKIDGIPWPLYDCGGKNK